MSAVHCQKYLRNGQQTFRVHQTPNTWRFPSWWPQLHWFRDGQALLNKIHDSPKIFKSVMLGIWGALSSLSFWAESRKMCREEAPMIIKKMARSQNSKWYTGDVRQVFYTCMSLRRRHWWRNIFCDFLWMSHGSASQLPTPGMTVSRMRKAHVVMFLYLHVQYIY